MEITDAVKISLRSNEEHVIEPQEFCQLLEAIQKVFPGQGILLYRVDKSENGYFLKTTKGGRVHLASVLLMYLFLSNLQKKVTMKSPVNVKDEELISEKKEMDEQAENTIGIPIQ